MYQESGWAKFFKLAMLIFVLLVLVYGTQIAGLGNMIPSNGVGPSMDGIELFFDVFGF